MLEFDVAYRTGGLRFDKGRSAGPGSTMATIKFGNKKIALPGSKILRILVGAVLVIGGLLGFLPILGFWMVPLGLIVLSNDVPWVRRQRRWLQIWWRHRSRKDRRLPFKQRD